MRILMIGFVFFSNISCLFAFDESAVLNIFPKMSKFEIALSSSSSFIIWYDPDNCIITWGKFTTQGYSLLLHFRSSTNNSGLDIIASGGIAGLPPGWAIINQNGELLYQFNCWEMVVPGNDSVYIEKGSLFNPSVTVKLSIGNNSVQENQQAIYSITQKDTARTSFPIYSMQNEKSNVVATIRKGAVVNVIGFTTSNYEDLGAIRWVLVESELGLVGWSKVFFTDKWFANQQPAMLRLFDNNLP